MRGARHESQAVAIEASTSKLDPHADAQLYIEEVFGAAGHWICAGLDWRGHAHSDKHQQHSAMLKSAGAPSEIPAAWQTLEGLRSGNWYGGRANGGRASQALLEYNVIKDWAIAGRPPASAPAGPAPAP